MPTTPQRLAHDFQRALQDLQKERERTRQLMAELDRQNHELDRLRSSVHRESNSRLLAEEALDETSDRLQLAVEAAGLALWDWQLPSQQVFLTARWGEMLGDIAVDGYWDTLALIERVHPDDRARAQATAGELLQGRQQRTVVQYRVRTAGGWLWIESHGMVAEHDAKGRPLRLMGSHADISERKRVEAEGAQARAQAEQASQAKSEFLANISHEVRTPLNALMGLTRLLMDSPLNTEQKSWLDLMDSSAHALLDLLNDVLDLSRIEAGKLSMENVQFPLRDTLAEVSALYAEQARTKPLSWELQLSARLPDHMQGDPGRLRQVLNNLLSNALKFTPPGGEIVIAFGVAGNWAFTEVRDSGPGFGPADFARIFSPGEPLSAKPTGALRPVPTAVPPMGSWRTRSSVSPMRSMAEASCADQAPSSWPRVSGIASIRWVRPVLTTLPRPRARRSISFSPSIPLPRRRPPGHRPRGSLCPPSWPSRQHSRLPMPQRPSTLLLACNSCPTGGKRGGCLLCQ